MFHGYAQVYCTVYLYVYRTFERRGIFIASLSDVRLAARLVLPRRIGAPLRPAHRLSRSFLANGDTRGCCAYFAAHCSLWPPALVSHDAPSPHILLCQCCMPRPSANTPQAPAAAMLVATVATSQSPRVADKTSRALSLSLFLSLFLSLSLGAVVDRHD